MAKKKKKSKKKSANSGGVIIGSLLRPVVFFFGLLLKIIVKALAFFGLWIPLVYAAFGALLYLVFDFNPFYLDVYGTLYLCGALACVVAAAIISIRNVIVRPARSIYQGYKHPFWEKRDEVEDEDPDRKRSADRAETVKSYKREAELNPPEIEYFKEEKQDEHIGDYLVPADDFACATDSEREDKKYSLGLDWLPQISSSEPESTDMRSLYRAERPKVYFSELDPDLLVHEYSDRFELYRVDGTELIFDSIKYRGNSY